MDKSHAHKVTEVYRVYYWSDGSEVRIDNVVEVIVSETTHRIKTEDGVTRLHIIPSGWNHIEINSAVDDWEF